MPGKLNHFKFFLQIDSMTLDTDLKWAKIMDPDPNSRAVDPHSIFEHPDPAVFLDADPD